MAIGNFGKLIVFETSDSRILNFDSWQRTISGNWASHDRIGKKPKSEFLNPNLQTVQFNIVLNAQHGVRPQEIANRIAKAVEKGQVETLVIGGQKIGSEKWKITQATEARDIVLNGGETVKCTLGLSLEEYI